MIIKRIKLENYTVFEDHQIEFDPGINIFIGETEQAKHIFLRFYIRHVNVSIRGFLFPINLYQPCFQTTIRFLV